MTRESFLSWWTTFSREELGALLQKEDEAFDILCGRIKTGEEGNFGFSKLSGKQLFEQQKVNTTSDISFLGDTPNDEAVFDAGLSLEPLELEAQEEDMFDKE